MLGLRGRAVPADRSRRRLREPPFAGDVHQPHAAGRTGSARRRHLARRPRRSGRRSRDGHTRALARPPHPLDGRAAAARGRGSRPDEFHHLSQQNIVFARNGERIASRSRSTGCPGRAVCRGFRRSSCCSRSGARAALLRRVVASRSRCSSVLLVVSDIAHAIGFEIPRPGGNVDEGRAVPRRAASSRSRYGSRRCPTVIALLAAAGRRRSTASSSSVCSSR